MSYHQKIETKLNDLQKEFFRLFRKTFPNLSNTIEIEKGIIHPDNFCFSVKSNSEIFGKLYFDIDDIEITVFSDFDHSHFPTYMNDYEENIQRRIQLTCIMTINYINSFVSGDIIVEYDQQGETILRTKQYHKDEQTTTFSATINLKEMPKGKYLIHKIKMFFHQVEKQPIVTKKVNWFGEIK